MIQRIAHIIIRKILVSPEKSILWTVLCVSLLLNVCFLFSSNHPDAWNSKTRAEGVLKVMEYVEIERQVDDIIRSEFVERIWQCLKENLTADVLYARAPQSPSETALSLKGSYTRRSTGRFLLSKPVVNPYNYSYYHNKAEICSQGKIDIILASPSAPTNFERRMKMRSGIFGTFSQDPQNRAKLLFFLGKPVYSEGLEPTSETQEKINLEQAKYNDIIQATFPDTYRDFISKGLLIPKWCSTFCPNSEFVIRVDDDVSANVENMILALKKTRLKHQHFVLGLQRTREIPVRDRTSKYFLSFEEYPYKSFPPYVLGGCMGYPVKTGELIFEACRRLRPIVWIDDVWISALCASRVQVPVLDDPSFHFKHGDKMAH